MSTRAAQTRPIDPDKHIEDEIQEVVDHRRDRNCPPGGYQVRKQDGSQNDREAEQDDVQDQRKESEGADKPAAKEDEQQRTYEPVDGGQDDGKYQHRPE